MELVKLDNLERLEREATAAPWIADTAIEDADDVERWYVGHQGLPHEDPGWAYSLARVGPVTNKDSEPDAKFIAAIRNDAPTLLAIARAANELLDAEAKVVDCAVHNRTQIVTSAVERVRSAREHLQSLLEALR